MRTCPHQPQAYWSGLSLNLKDKKQGPRCQPPPHPRQQSSWKSPGWSWSGCLGAKSCQRAKFSPRGSLRDRPSSALAVGPEVRQRLPPDSLPGGQRRLGLGSRERAAGGGSRSRERKRRRPEGRLPGRGAVRAWRGALPAARPLQPRALLPAGRGPSGPGPASSSGARRPPALRRGLRERGGGGGRESGERVPAAPRPPGLGAVGARRSCRGPGLPSGTPAGFLPSSRPSCRPPPSSPARSRPAAPAAAPLHIVRRLWPSPPLPPAGPRPGVSSLFITYFDPASLCPRFLRTLYCPRSRVFD